MSVGKTTIRNNEIRNKAPVPDAYVYTPCWTNGLSCIFPFMLPPLLKFMDLIESFVPNFKSARSRNSPAVLEMAHREGGGEPLEAAASLPTWNIVEPPRAASNLPRGSKTSK